ncbi:hypothetical protein [Cypionkella sp.]|uniref:hypothetical protein n=1 Tax=Cypionkella sp. TaxID=2811411 RepID=UPI002ABA1864|nr:hypothetical protein [Cypionkella sp.]MDZ4393115.1 hypothetical protein [Cypionkella sp.]
MGLSAQAVTRFAAFVLALLLCLGVIAPDARAQEEEVPPAGLLWNKTGLPAVFPLQVKTLPGRDHVVTLLDAETGEEALAAYIRGGAFFRVLVPPGGYRLRFVSGKDWRGAEALFGSEVEVFELRRTLRFETRGLGTKAGHIVDRRGRGTEAQIKDQRICQSFRPDFPRQLVPDQPVRPLRRDVRSRYCG